MAREIHDHYFHKAKAEGYRSRAAYKLIEIDDRRKVLTKGDAVLDAGAAPGSWLQVAARRVGPSGIVVGIDLKAIEPDFKEPNIHVMRGDVTTTPRDDLIAPLLEHRREGKTPDPFFGVLLSDMAPDTTGDRTIDHYASVRLAHGILDRCAELLAPGGHVVIKVFEGEAYPELLQRAKAMFEAVKGFSPKASRGESTEIYLIAHRYRGEAAARGGAGTRDAGEHAFPLPKRKPSKGWGSQEG